VVVWCVGVVVLSGTGVGGHLRSVLGGWVWVEWWIGRDVGGRVWGRCVEGFKGLVGEGSVWGGQ
jgi:hypothetical protein